MKKMRKLMSLLLALSVVLGCSVNAFAALPEEEEIYEPQQLIPVYFGEPPYAGIDYNGEVYISPMVRVGLMTTIADISAFALGGGFPPDMGTYLLETLRNSLLDAILRSDVVDEYADNDEYYYRQLRFQSDRPDCVRILRKYYFDNSCPHHSNTSKTDPCDSYIGYAEYYILYV